jgi:DNA-binding response OmpR family regulator
MARNGRIKMKILILDDRAEKLDFLLEDIIRHGYRAGIAKDGDEVTDMLSGEQYNVVLTNGGHRSFPPDHLSRIRSSSVFVIGITDQQKRDDRADSSVDLCLRRPFEASKLWQAFD